MTTFGQQVRLFRRACRDPLRGGVLTQTRLGELLGDELGHAGYSGAAVSDWERNKSKIHADDRFVLVSLISIFNRLGNLQTLADANQFLQAGNYRALDAKEQAQVFPDAQPTREHVGDQPKFVLTPKRRKQLILLEKVRRFWVKGVLDKSVQGMMLLDIDGRSYDAAVDQPWQHVIGVVAPMQVEAETAVSTSNLHTHFLQTDRALLLLGEPGSGKTFALITLAKSLISQAEMDPIHPIPVIFNLVSWAEKRQSMTNWIVEELTAKYQIPHTLGQQWLAEDELILLLDGLDEVPLQYRSACVAALNHFRERQGLTGIVVNSRREAYEGLPTKLQLGGAYLLQPLTLCQIDAYLTAAGDPLLGLKTAVQFDPALQELAQTPLMLHVLSVAYWQTKTVLEEDGNINHFDLFESYIQAMFARRGDQLVYPAAQVKTWLTLLAQQMDKHNQALFLIEQLQPSWLRSNHWQWSYLVGSRLFAGLVASILMWLFWLLVHINVPQFSTEWSRQIEQTMPGKAAQTDLWLMLFLGVGIGLITAVIDGFDYKRIANQGYPVIDLRRRRRMRTAVTSIITSLLAMGVVAVFDHIFLAFSFGVVVGVAFGLITYFVYGSNMRDDIRTVAALDWTWSGAFRGLLIGVLLAGVVEIIEWALFGSSQVIRTVFALGLVFMLLGGLRGHRVTMTSKPNQGIRLSIVNAVSAGLIVGGVMLVVTAVAWQNLTLGLVGSLLALCITIFMFGGGNVANHYYLRLLLWLTKDLPADLISFLEFSVDRVFLHRVGGGYLFIHQFLQEFFAQDEIS